MTAVEDKQQRSLLPPLRKSVWRIRNMVLRIFCNERMDSAMPYSSMFCKGSATIKAFVIFWGFNGDGINTAPSTLYGPKPQKLCMDDDCSTWAYREVLRRAENGFKLYLLCHY